MDLPLDLPLGWVDFERRTDSQMAAHNSIVSRMPSFGLAGEKPPVGTKIILTDLWKHPKTVEVLGKPFTGWHQFTGSCVGVGGGNGAQTTLLADKLIRAEPEKPVLLFWPYNYGRSRLLGGMRGRGEGSFGSTFAKSLSEDGATEWDVEGVQLPSVQYPGQMEIGKAAEMEWSDGTRAEQPVRNEAKEHKFISAPLSAAVQVRDSIVNGYGVTRAGMVFCNPGTSRVKSGALVGSYNGRGGHQESWLGYWNHPELGELFYEMNQWGANAYGTCPSGAAPGGVWVAFEEVDRFCKAQNAEVYALSGYDGYPARPEVFDWSTQSLWS
jgi:hypothetical protein